ncbi:unnamed protein product [Cuscuta campestris]|uniref:Uncharacterized protein n=1 Tax=Cuscuta campestris TaxID=132261 RepID=A0A484NGS2_9ASTE|nr:unnamed protein product [Cuscuta campestris]
MFGVTLGRSCCIGAFISRSSYSTATAGRETSPLASSFLPEFLTGALGFSKKESIKVAAKVIKFSSRTRPVLVVHILKQTGLDSSQIRKCVSRVPRLLYFDVQKTLRPKLECLQELGFSTSDLAGILAKGADILTAGLDTYLRPNLAALAQIFGGNTDDLRKTIKSYPWLLCAVRCRVVLENVSYFKELGFLIDKIRWFMTIDQDTTYDLSHQMVSGEGGYAGKRFRHSPCLPYVLLWSTGNV